MLLRTETVSAGTRHELGYVSFLEEELCAKHVIAVGVLDVALGLSGLVGTPFVLISMVGGGLVTGQWRPMLFLPAMGVAITLLFLLFSIPTLVAGIGILRQTTWARPVGLFAAAVIW